MAFALIRGKQIEKIEIVKILVRFPFFLKFRDSSIEIEQTYPEPGGGLQSIPGRHRQLSENVGNYHLDHPPLNSLT